MSELVFASKTPEEKATVHPADKERPVYALPGGGKKIRFCATGREVVIGGESLRRALEQRRICKPGPGLFINPPIWADGKEAIIEGKMLVLWLRRGAKDLGPNCVVVGEEPIPKQLGKSVPEQQEEARIQENNQREADRKGPYRTAYVGR